VVCDAGKDVAQVGLPSRLFRVAVWVSVFRRPLASEPAKR
jgi:hypothetical protein